MKAMAYRFCFSALTCFINPRDDLNFTAILTSPFFNMSSEALANTKLCRQNQEHFYDTLKRLKPDALIRVTKSGSIIQTVSANVSTRVLIGMISIKVPAQSAIKPILIYYLKKSRIMKKSMAAASLVFNSIAQARDLEAAEANAVSKEDDVVRFMSIHQSKGLEFPVVFLWASSNNAKY